MATETTIIPTQSCKWTWGDLQQSLGEQVAQNTNSLARLPVQAKLLEPSNPEIEIGVPQQLVPCSKLFQSYDLTIAPDFEFGIVIFQNSSDEFLDEYEALHYFGVENRTAPISQELCQHIAKQWKAAGFTIKVRSSRLERVQGALKILLLAIARQFQGYIAFDEPKLWVNYGAGVYSAKEFQMAEPLV